MSKLDYCIRMQFRMIAGELVAAGFLLVMAGLFLSYGGFFGGSGYPFMWKIGIPCLIAEVLLAFSVLRKLFIRSVYGSSAGLYQSLPLSAGDLGLSKIFAAGTFMLAAFLPVFFIFGNGLGSYYVGRYRISAAVTQILVNQGYVHSQVPLFAALVVVSLVLGCFAAAAAVQLVIALINQDSRDGEKRSRGTALAEAGFAVLTAAAVTALNFLPYWLLLRSGTGHLMHPAMLPGAGILINGVIMLAAGRSSVKVMER